jgi:hypothetical protein
MKKFMLIAITALVSAGLFLIPVSASVVDPGTGAMDNLENDSSSEQNSEETTEASASTEEKSGGNVRLMTGEELIGSTATMADVDEYVEDKGGQVIHIIQKVCSYIVGIIFIVCLVMVVIGAIAHNQWVGRGAIGCLICLIVYCAIYFGPALLEWFRAWSAPGV